MNAQLTRWAALLATTSRWSLVLWRQSEAVRRRSWGLQHGLAGLWVAYALQENTKCCHTGLHNPEKRLNTSVRMRAEQKEEAPSNICLFPVPTYRAASAECTGIHTRTLEHTKFCTWLVSVPWIQIQICCKKAINHHNLMFDTGCDLDW